MPRAKPYEQFADFGKKKVSTTPLPVTRANTKRVVNTAPALAQARSYPNTSTNASAATVSPDKPLTEKQKLFVQNWAKGDSVNNAALRAGFASPGMAYRLVHMPNVLRLKAQYEKKYEEESQMTRKKVMDGFLEAIEMAKLMSEPATMVSGWREIAKMCGYMAPVEHKVKVDVTGNVTMQQLTQLSDAELLEVIQKDAPALPFVEDVTPNTPPEPL